MTPTVLLLLLLAQVSQPPAPRPTENKGTPQESQASQEQAKPAPDTRGTDQQPLVVRVPKTEAETDQEQKGRENEAFNKNAVLALTGLTVLVAILQVVMLAKQIGIAGEQNTIIVKQNEIMSRQNEIAASTTRPYVGVGTWRLKIGESQTSPLTVTFRVMNSGNTPAQVDSIVANCFIGATSPFSGRPDYRGAQSIDEHFYLGPNKDDRSELLSVGNPPTQQQIDGVNAGTQSVWISGQVTYRPLMGTEGTVYRTGFAVTWKHNIKDFAAITAEGYNWGT